MTEQKTPGLDDIDNQDVQEMGESIRGLEEGQTVRATSSHLNSYIEGEVVETKHQYNGMEYYEAIVSFDGTKAEIHANWRDIPPDADDQETPYTGLIIEPFNDTAPPLTDIEVVEEGD